MSIKFQIIYNCEVGGSDSSNSYTANYVSGSKEKHYMHDFLPHKWKQKPFRHQILPITLSTCKYNSHAKRFIVPEEHSKQRITEPSFNMTIWYVQIKWMNNAWHKHTNIPTAKTKPDLFSHAIIYQVSVRMCHNTKVMLYLGVR